MGWRMAILEKPALLFTITVRAFIPMTGTNMPYADFCRRVRMICITLSHDFVTPSRSPEVSSTAFRASPPNLRSAPLMEMDFKGEGAAAALGHRHGRGQESHLYALRIWQCQAADVRSGNRQLPRITGTNVLSYRYCPLTGLAASFFPAERQPVWHGGPLTRVTAPDTCPARRSNAGRCRGRESGRSCCGQLPGGPRPWHLVRSRPRQR